jgi:hypothetical protein
MFDFLIIIFDEPTSYLRLWVVGGIIKNVHLMNQLKPIFTKANLSLDNMSRTYRL